ncbi:hypothetical protein CSB37_03340 [bacterium DOLZORAL124_38_8]|nr:MAG: hypothetical protein CSB37_03340 [bacterium DOLZORAL124_38_8]
MKTKIVSILCLSLFLVACNQNTTTNPDKTPTKTVVTEEKTNPIQPAETTVEEKTVVEEVDLAAPMKAMDNIKQNDLVNSIQSFKLADEGSFKSCVKYAVENCQQETVNQKALADKSDASCDLLKDEYAKTNCKNTLWTQLAQQDQKAELCEKITDKYQQADCKNNIFTQQAVAAKNPKLCDKVKMYIEPMPNAEGEKTDAKMADMEDYRKQDCLEQVKFAKEMPEMDKMADETPATPVEEPAKPVAEPTEK